jgi:hypothetical protein
VKNELVTASVLMRAKPATASNLILAGALRNARLGLVQQGQILLLLIGKGRLWDDSNLILMLPFRRI